MLAVTDCRISDEAASALKRNGFQLLRMPPHPSLPHPVASHPDMLFFCGRNAIYCTTEYFSIAKQELQQISAACQKEIRAVSQSVSHDYPFDILFNIAVVGESAFCLKEHTATEILSEEPFDFYSVKQGYTKCSVIPVDERSLITADASIAAVATRRGLDILLLREQATDLQGYDTGFIGGATSYSPYFQDPNIYFCGDLDTHPQSREIRRFCAERNRTCISLTQHPLQDVGTVFLF